MVDAKLLTYFPNVSGSFQHWEGKECKSLKSKNVRFSQLSKKLTCTSPLLTISNLKVEDFL